MYTIHTYVNQSTYWRAFGSRKETLETRRNPHGHTVGRTWTETQHRPQLRTYPGTLELWGSSVMYNLCTFSRVYNPQNRQMQWHPWTAEQIQQAYCTALLREDKQKKNGLGLITYIFPVKSWQTNATLLLPAFLWLCMCEFHLAITNMTLHWSIDDPLYSIIYREYKFMEYFIANFTVWLSRLLREEHSWTGMQVIGVICVLLCSICTW